VFAAVAGFGILFEQDTEKKNLFAILLCKEG